jgi:hypothetical protein
MPIAVLGSLSTPGRHTRRIGVVALLFPILVDRDSSVGITTRYELDGTGIESRWGEVRFCVPVFRPTLAPTQSPVQWVPGHFLWGKRESRVEWGRIRGPAAPMHLGLKNGPFVHRF